MRLLVPVPEYRWLGFYRFGGESSKNTGRYKVFII